MSVIPLPKNHGLCSVYELPWCWRIKWADTAGYIHVSRIMGPCEEHIAHLAVASHHAEDFYDVIESRKVVVS